MTTTPALGADKAIDERIDLRALFEKLTAAKYKPQVARGLHLKNPDGSFQVSSIEMEFRAWQDGYRAAAPAPVSGMPDLAPEECTLCNGMGMLDGSGAICPHCNGDGKEPVAATLPTAPAPTEQPSHETIVREGNMLTCTACGTSKKMADPCAAPTEQAGDVSFCTNGGTPMATYTPAKLDQDWEQAGELPPLPAYELVLIKQYMVGNYLSVYRGFQMHDYARAALAARQTPDGGMDAK